MSYFYSFSACGESVRNRRVGFCAFILFLKLTLGALQAKGPSIQPALSLSRRPALNICAPFPLVKKQEDTAEQSTREPRRED